jgi:hypothetical protein
VEQRATVTDDAWKWADLPCFLLLFPSLPAVRNTTTCKTQKNASNGLFCFTADPVSSSSGGRSLDHGAGGLWALVEGDGEVACWRRSVAVEETEGEKDLLKWGEAPLAEEK